MSEERIIGQNLAKKIRAVQQGAANIPKNGYNDFHKYKYVLAADAVDAIRKMCVEQGLVFAAIGIVDTKLVAKIASDRGKESLVWETTIRYLITDPDSGESVTFDWRGHGADPMDKGIFKAMTGTLKYALMQFFMVAGEDSDPETVSKQDRRDAKKATGKAKSSPTEKASANQAGAGVASSEKIKYIQTLLKSEYVPGPVRGKVDAWLTANKGKWTDVATSKMIEKLMAFAATGVRRGTSPVTDKQLELVDKLIQSQAVPKNIGEKIGEKLSNHRSDADFNLTSGEASAMIECCNWYIQDRAATEKAKAAPAEKDPAGKELDAIQDQLALIDGELASRTPPSDNHLTAFKDWRDASTWTLEDCGVWLNTILTWPVKKS